MASVRKVKKAVAKPKRRVVNAAKVCPAATTEILLAGSGGQGVILAGKLVAQAAIGEGYNATYIPSYGAEVRGGTAHCHVKMGRRPIGSPIVEDATILVAMNEPSYKAFSSLLRKGSTLVVNSSLVPTIGKHPGVKIVSQELTKIAADMGSMRSANMLVFGVCAGLVGLKDREQLLGILGGVLGKKNPGLLEVNQRIFEKGFELGQAAAAE
ncbi:MAG: 2-oxoacid:acceptor oxidoreductase family protein [Planctomycetaceae bacterium]|nr:2-oxoacid:acceptor oxidoreductase family protein [Planctomycetaceae bacterium]